MSEGAGHVCDRPGPGALGAVDGTDHQQLVGVQGNEENNELVTFVASLPVFTGGGVQGMGN